MVQVRNCPGGIAGVVQHFNQVRTELDSADASARRNDWLNLMPWPRHLTGCACTQLQVEQSQGGVMNPTRPRTPIYAPTIAATKSQPLTSVPRQRCATTLFA
jgi:hypothetical protein